MRRETIILCVGCRARVERETPGRWAWSEAPSGLRCGAEECARRADAEGVRAVHAPRKSGRGWPRGKPLSPEHRAKIAAAALGRKGTSPSAETREKIAATLRGRTVGAETRRKIAVALRDRRRNPTTLAKRRAG
jgi:hypothetical protein